MAKAKFIVFYGINNLGKTTQAKKLVERLNKEGYKSEYLKYPIYDLKPSGPILNDYLRHNNPYNLSPREAQIIYTNNRIQYQKTLQEKLDKGINIIAEDYTGTGLAWGIGAGVEKDFLENINSSLLKEDLAFLFDGDRFTNAKENGHKHENNDTLTEKVREIHLNLAKEKNWRIINANSDIEEIHQKIFSYVISLIKYPQLAPNFKVLYKKQEEEMKKNKETLYIEKIHPDAKIPTRAHSYDAGIDVYALKDYTIFPNDNVSSIQTGIKMKFHKNYVALVWDKSGLAKEGLKTIGGVLDSNYRGEIIILLKNLGNNVIKIKKGQKVAQILIQKVKFPTIVETKIKDNTERQDKAFGSSGLF